MGTTVSDFIISYSDDMVFLDEVRTAYLTHPLESGLSAKALFDSHCCRMLSILIIGNVESLLRKWNEMDERIKVNFLEDTLKSGELTDAKLKAYKIADYFRQNGVIAEENEILEYMGIKNLRNAVVHSDMSIKKEEILNETALCSDVNELSEDNWNRMLYINKKMLRYINEYCLKKIKVNQNIIDHLIEIESPMVFFNRLKMAEYTSFESIFCNIPINTNKPNILNNYYTKDQLYEIMWYNIEKMDIEVYQIDADEEASKDLIESVTLTWQCIIDFKFPDFKNIDVNYLDDCIIFFKTLTENPLLVSENATEYLWLSKKIDFLIKNYCILNLYVNLASITKYQNHFKDEALKILKACIIKQHIYAHERNKEFNDDFLQKYKTRLRINDN